VVAEILNKYKNDISVARMVPSSGGVFYVRVDGHTVFFNKDEEDRFPNPGESVERIESFRQNT
jgi:selT/selW/selH-like putative selenoprotein